MRLRIFTFVLALCAALVAPAATGGATPTRNFNIRAFGAKSGGDALNTKAIQAAIDAAHATGNGRVIIPQGRFLTGTLFLKSNVEIHLEQKASLEGSNSLADYVIVPLSTEEPQFSQCLFYVKNADNISLVGEAGSSIDGRGYFFKNERRRPRLFRIEYCRNIKVTGVTLKNSGSWCLVFTGCDQVALDRVSIYNKENGNNDGIDFDGCSNATVTHCNLQTVDDAICLKSSIDKICENITVTDCTVSSLTAALKLGTASKTGFRHVRVTNCQFFDCPMGAIKLLLVDGGVLEDVEISDVKMFQCGGPIFIRLGNRGRTYDTSIPQVYGKDVTPEGRPIGILRNVRIANVEATLYARKADTEGVLITGIPGHRVQNVVLENLTFRFSGHHSSGAEERTVPEDVARYPEQSFFGPLPSYAIFLRHADNITVRNVRLILDSPDSRPPLYLDDVTNSHFQQVAFDSPPAGSASLVLRDVRASVFDRLQAINRKDFVADVSGAQSGHVELINSAAALSLAQDVPANAVLER